MNFKFLSNSTKNSTTKNQPIKFITKEEPKTHIEINKPTNENTSPNTDLIRLTPKNLIKTSVVHSTRNIGKKTKSFNFDNKTVTVNNTDNKGKEDLYIKPNLERVKISHKSFGVIEGYAALTTEGIVRNYNEDRVSIIFNISKPPNYQGDDWPRSSFFGLYDGHGGSTCADFLRDNLHKYIINDVNFPNNPQKAILNGFVSAEKNFLEKAKKKENYIDRSGSCAIVVLIIDIRCYIANVGDSRAIMSSSQGEKVYSLSRDHRPTDEKEYKRVIDAGGKIYQTEARTSITGENILGPLRVAPGKLSVSRAIGDIEAKDVDLGGNPNVIIGLPEIKYFEINQNNDFILIGCDGMFEKMKNKEIIEIIWKGSESKTKDIHNLCGILAEKVVDECIRKKSTDNLTAVLISLKGTLDKTITDNKALTQQVNKIPKMINNINMNPPVDGNNKSSKNMLSKIIKLSQLKMNGNTEKYIPINK